MPSEIEKASIGEYAAYFIVSHSVTLKGGSAFHRSVKSVPISYKKIHLVKSFDKYVSSEVDRHTHVFLLLIALPRSR